MLSSQVEGLAVVENGVTVTNGKVATTTTVAAVSSVSSPVTTTEQQQEQEDSPSKNSPPLHHKKKIHHFVFGYGSLICPDSRKITNPSLATKPPLPVVVQNVERVWSARTQSGYTAMGVQFKPGAECTGILLEVEENELQDLDEREANYNRLPIMLNHVEQVPFLDEEEYYEDDHVVFEAKQDTKLEERVKVWIYMQKDPISADPSHPIPQTYVDIIIRGCLTISEEFAKSFIETTAGWEHEEDHWVDDREIPIYKRADPLFSSQHGDRIDSLLEEADAIESDVDQARVQYDPVEHLEALADALEEDKAHPKAIKHVVQRVKAADNGGLLTPLQTASNGVVSTEPKMKTESK